MGHLEQKARIEHKFRAREDKMVKQMYRVELKIRNSEIEPLALTPEMMSLIDIIDPVGDECGSSVEITADQRIEKMLDDSPGVLSWNSIPGEGERQ